MILSLSKGKAPFYFLLLVLFITGLAVGLYFIPPPGQPSSGKTTEQLNNIPYIVSEGKLPGVTWGDDIHPIFIRNKCGNCHTRGDEATVEGLEQFSLGLIDPKDWDNPYYSYHELVYAEGPPQIQKGENLRDGQCCWPFKYHSDKQRRIWIGHAERSAIIHKLDRDYYDWGKPPRFLEEGLRLSWGMPMPMYEKEEEHSEDQANHNIEHNEAKETHKYEVRPFFKRILLHFSLWLGGSSDELHTLPPRIPVKDRGLLRYWINNTLQVMEEGTGIEVQVFGSKGEPIKNALVHLVGNYNSPERQEVEDRIDLRTDENGKVLLSFPIYSVITSFWYAAAEKDEVTTKYIPATVVKNRVNKIKIIFN